MFMLNKAARVLSVCLALVLLSCAWPVPAPAEETTIIRVGWYDTPYNRKDALNRRSGYAYEYQRKIAAYTGWKYEYVEGGWSELMQMLQDGRIDLLSDVSFTEERAEKMLYSHLPMGTEAYYLFTAPNNPEIRMENVSSLNGKKIGVIRGTVQRDMLAAWAEDNDVRIELIELEGTEEEGIRQMNHGELDAFVTLELYGNPDSAVPLWRIGGSDFYFALSKNRADLLLPLDNAMDRILEENRFYNEDLSMKYFQNVSSNLYLSSNETDWLNAHGKIRVGYQDHYLAFCATDPATGQLTGALKDYLELASASLSNASPEFEAVGYPTAAAAMEALRNGEVDCMFPANLSDYDGEAAGVIMSKPLMRTEMDAVIRAEDKQNFLRRTQVRVGVNRGNPNYEMFLMDHFPNWTPVLYENTPACLDAVASRKTDCIIISNYRFRDISAQCKKLNLTTVYTGVNMDYCFAVKEGNTVLYSILSKMICRVPETAVSAALTYYSSETVPTGFFAYLEENPLTLVLAVFSLVMTGIAAMLLFRNCRQGKGKR